MLPAAHDGARVAGVEADAAARTALAGERAERGGAALEHTVPDKLRMRVQEMMMQRCTVRCRLTWTIHMTTWKASTACHSG